MTFRKMRSASIAALMLSGLAPAAYAGATLDSISGPVEFKFAGFSTEQVLTPGSNETTWSVGNVTSITDGFNNLWVSGQDGDRLTMMVYGIADFSVVPDGSGGFNIYNNGATGGAADGKIHVDVWLDNGPTTVADVSGGPGARSGFGSYPTLTDGSLFLAMELIPGIVVDDPNTALDEGANTTMFQSASAATSPASGDGIFYANVVGGSAMSQFNTNGFTTLLGTEADMIGQFDFKPALTAPGCAGGAVTPACWENVLNDPVLGIARVPVPAPILLLGAGALIGGLMASRRRNDSEAA